MNIGILGSGDVAKALARAFIAHGDEVMLGTRDASKLAEFAKEQPTARAGSFSEAAAFGGVIVLATLGTATLSVLEQAGIAKFDGKIVIDATNPLLYTDSGPKLSVGFDDSLGEQVQRALPKARVVKAFNTVGNALMYKPQFENGPPTMFIAGNDGEAKTQVTKLLADFGWDVADLGGIESSRYLEPMCMAWVLYGFNTGTWGHAFKLLT